MKMRGSKWLMGWMVLMLLVPGGTSVMAEEDEKELGWSDTADFSLVATDGNSESLTIGAKNVLTRTWEKAKLDLTVGVIRAETNDINRYAVEGEGQRGFNLREENDREADPERYFFNGRYNRLISEKLYWYVGLDWERNRPAAVENRIIGSGGLGNIWFNTDKIKWHTDYGVTYTDEEDTTNESTSYAGVRLRSTYEQKFNDTTTFRNTLNIDENLDETSDFRADMLNEVQVAMNKRLALKVGLLVEYDNEPAFEDVDLYARAPGSDCPSECSNIGTVDGQKDSVDTTFTGSLVVNF